MHQKSGDNVAAEWLALVPHAPPTGNGEGSNAAV
jgi:hypothetical protein